MNVKVKSSETDTNMDRHVVLECGHTSTISFEMLRGNAARKMPRPGSMFDCALCGPEPTVAEKQGPVVATPKANEGTTPKPTNEFMKLMEVAKPLEIKLKEYFGVDKLESKLARIKAILEEE